MYIYTNFLNPYLHLKNGFDWVLGSKVLMPSMTLSLKKDIALLECQTDQNLALSIPAHPSEASEFCNTT